MNMATVIAVYAALCKEMKLPLRFPGSATSYHAIMEMTDAGLADTSKARRFGFYEWVDTEEMLLRLCAQFQKMRFIP